MFKGQYHGDIEVKGYFRVRHASSAEIVMVEKVIEKPPVLDGIDHRSLPVHLLQVFFHVFIDINPFK